MMTIDDIVARIDKIGIAVTEYNYIQIADMILPEPDHVIGINKKVYRVVEKDYMNLDLLSELARLPETREHHTASNMVTLGSYVDMVCSRVTRIQADIAKHEYLHSAGYI